MKQFYQERFLSHLDEVELYGKRGLKEFTYNSFCDFLQSDLAKNSFKNLKDYSSKKNFPLKISKKDFESYEALLKKTNFEQIKEKEMKEEAKEKKLFKVK